MLNIIAPAASNIMKLDNSTSFINYLIEVFYFLYVKVLLFVLITAGIVILDSAIIVVD